MPFIESARLELDDDSSGKIKKINSELSKLVKTANSAKKAFRGLDFKGLKGLAKVSSDVNKVTSSISKLASASSKLRHINMKVNAPGLQRATAALNKLRTSAGKPITQNVRVRYVGQRNQSLRNRFLQNRTQRVTQLINFRSTGMASLLHGFVYDIGESVRNAITTGFKEGYKTQDIADTRLKMYDLDQKNQDAAYKAARDVSGIYPVVNPAQALSIYGESLPIANNDPTQAKALTMASAGYVRQLVELGSSVDDAIDKMYLLGKAGEQSGNILDKMTGTVKAEKVAHFFDLLTKMSIQEGREMTPDLIEKTFKSMRGAKFALDDRGILMALSYAAEMGSSAGVGVNQMVKNLSGHTTKEVLANQAELGLIKLKEVPVGKVGKKKSTQIVSAGMVDNSEELLRADPMAYTEKYLLPAMKKAGLDHTKASDDNKFAYMVASDRTAVELVTSLLYRYNNISRNVDNALGRNTSDTQKQALADQSGLLALQEASSQVQGLFGEIATSMESGFIPALRTVASVAQSMSNWIAGPDDKPTEHSFARAGLLGTAGLAGLFMGGKFLNYMFNPLMGSALALNGSAAALTSAAVALGGAAAGNGITDGIKGGTRLGALALLALKRIGFPLGAYMSLSGSEINDPKANAAVKDPSKIGLWDTIRIRSMMNADQRHYDDFSVSGGKANDSYLTLLNTEFSKRSNLKQLHSILVSEMSLPLHPNIMTNTSKGHIRSQEEMDAYDRYRDVKRMGEGPVGTGISSVINSGVSLFKQTFESSTSSIESAGQEVANAVNGAGAQVSQGIIGAAGQFGSVAGAAMAAAIQGAVANIKVTTPASAPRDTSSADTGHVMGPH